MSTQPKPQKFQQQIWYIIINNQTRGPLSLRDLDVLLRTSEINSFTYAWKNGMKEWKLMNQIQEIKESILQSSKEIFQIQQQKRGGEKETVNKQEEKKQTTEEQKNLDQIIQNKDQNIYTILETTVDNLLQKTFHQTEDGKWNIYDQQKGQWIQQDQQPTQKMEIMKRHLFNKLKNQLFFGEKNNFNKRGKKPQQKEENQKDLTPEQLAKRERNRRKTKRAAEKKKQKWYQAKVNTFIYITGLPLDATQDQLKQFCSKAGVLRIDLTTGKQKIKLYKDENGLPKGDAAVSFARPQSVQIALELLNGAQIRSGFKVNVQRAQFQQKAQQYIPRQSKKQTKINKIQAKKLQNKLFGWNQEDQQQTGQGLRIVILKNVFPSPQTHPSNQQIQTLKAQIQQQISKIGQIHRIRYYQTHPDGVVQVKFKTQKDAQNCIQILDGKIFNTRQLQVQYWDGQTDYKRNQISLMLQQQRLNKFAEQLQNNQHEQNINNNNKQQQTENKQ